VGGYVYKMNPNNSYYVTQQFHALHCINLMRRMKIEFDNIFNNKGIICKSDIDGNHINHCIGFLNYTLFNTDKLFEINTIIVNKQTYFYRITN